MSDSVATPRGKNIIICYDGTGNEYSENDTNVVKLFQAIVRDRDQIALYDPGVGTVDALGRTIGKKLGRLLGLAFGWGLTKNIEDGYSYLMNHYEPGDKLFLFGFSRGAFTARALAGMLRKVRLLERGSDELVPDASRIYNQTGNEDIAEGFGETFGRECKPYLVGVWDTVASLGHIYGRRFFDQTLNPDTTFGYHAMAIDEQRKKFPVSRWDESEQKEFQTIEQVWFAGVHSDVGGFYPERGLSDISLEWMAEQAEAAGLRLREGWREGLANNATAENALHDSRVGFWKLWPAVHRPIPEGAKIHNSVVERMTAPGLNYYPRNLPRVYKTV
ncbi:MAG: DUF2235 domain-containing protein [Myxococcota bacterium]